MSEIEHFKRMLLNYVLVNYPLDPVMVTYTTTLQATLKSNFLVMRAWVKFKQLMRNHPRYKFSKFSLVAWSQEFSKNSTHLHALFYSVVPLASHEIAWRSLLFDDAGHCYVTTGASWAKYIDYIFKDKKRIDKFMGHSVTLKTKVLRTYLQK